MIYVDELFDTTPYTRPETPRCFQNTMSCHMFSDLPGDEGTIELTNFAKRVGLKPEWIQHKGSFLEHFDLTVSRRAKAASLGAKEVSRRVGAEITIKKRDGNSELEW